MIDEQGREHGHPAYLFARNLPDGGHIVVSTYNRSIQLGSENGEECLISMLERFLRSCGMLHDNEHLDVVEK